METYTPCIHTMARVETPAGVRLPYPSPLIDTSIIPARTLKTSRPLNSTRWMDPPQVLIYHPMFTLLHSGVRLPRKFTRLATTHAMVTKLGLIHGCNHRRG